MTYLGERCQDGSRPKKRSLSVLKSDENAKGHKTEFQSAVRSEECPRKCLQKGGEECGTTLRSYARRGSQCLPKRRLQVPSAHHLFPQRERTCLTFVELRKKSLVRGMLTQKGFLSGRVRQCDVIRRRRSGHRNSCIALASHRPHI